MTFKNFLSVILFLFMAGAVVTATHLLWNVSHTGIETLGCSQDGRVCAYKYVTKTAADTTITWYCFNGKSLDCLAVAEKRIGPSSDFDSLRMSQ